MGGGVANEKNLIPIEHLSSEEAKKRGSKGGKKSAEVRRRKKSLKEAMRAALSLPVSNTESWNALAKFGIAPESIDNQNAIVVAMVIEAMSGNVKAFNAIRNVIGEDNDTEHLKLQQKELKMKEAKQDGTSGDGKLSELIKGLKDDLHE